MKTIKLLICKIVNFILRKLGRGTSFPGKLLLKLDKNYVGYFKMPKTVIAVTGSAGKGSTTKIIAEVLKKVVIQYHIMNMVVIYLEEYYHF